MSRPADVLPADATPGPAAAPGVTDPARVARLHATALLDTPAEAAFDRLTRLAARILGVPVALVSLVDADRQQIKSCMGLPERFAAHRDTPLSDSFCQHVVASAQAGQPAPLVIEDARRDPRVRDSRAIPDLGVVAYAGIPLVTADGHALGSFCVLDRVPRRWTEHELATLADLAAATMTEIELRETAAAARRQGEELQEAAAAHAARSVAEAARAEAEAARAEADRAQASLRFALSAGKLGAWELDVATWRLAASDECRANFGWPPAADPGSPPFDYWEMADSIHPADRPAMLAGVRDALAAGADYGAEYRVRWPDGSEHWVAAHGRVIVDQAGTPRKMIGVTQDVTERRRAAAERERLLSETEGLRAAAEAGRARLHGMLQQAPAIIAVLRGPDHRFELANDECERALGHRGLVGRTMAEAVPEVVSQGLVALLDRVFATGEAFVGRDLPLRTAPAAGAPLVERYYSFVYQPLPAHEGTPAGIFALGIDVTDSVRARQSLEAGAAALAASEARYRSLAEAVPVQVWTARPDGGLDFVSERTAAYFGAPAAALLGDGWAGFVHPDDLPAAWARWSRALASATPYETEFRLRTGAGDYRWHLARALPERDAAGAVTGWVGSNTDVEAERLARAEAEAASRAKSEFLAVMSHELRTPLNAIGGHAQLVELGLHGPVTVAQAEALARIQRSQRHLLGLIEDVLNFAKLDAGRVQYAVADVPVAEAAADALVMLAPQFAARRIEVAVGGDDAGAAGAPLAARADPEKVRQVLLNLLGNAAKFTRPGGAVTVSWRAAELPGGAPAVAVSVADTGIGIAPEQIERVFEPFVQVERRLNRPSEGAGLGLAISRDLARGMGGDIILESTPGAGSTFTLVLPR